MVQKAALQPNVSPKYPDVCRSIRHMFHTYIDLHNRFPPKYVQDFNSIGISNNIMQSRLQHSLI